MMNRTYPFILLLLILPLLTVSCGGSGRRGRSAPTTERFGYVLGKYNISIDGEYNPDTGHVISGYTAVTVAIANKSFKALRLRPDKDRWRIKDRRGKWHRGINEIQYEAADAWQNLHPDAQRLMAYPLMVPPGYTQTFEIFVPGEHDLSGFRAIQHHNAILGKTFTFTRY